MSAARRGREKKPRKGRDDDSDDMYDEIDRFHQSRDTLRFNDAVGSGDKRREVLPVTVDDEEEAVSDDGSGGFDAEDSDDADHNNQDNEQYLPSAFAWGKRRRDFYNTSYVDKDYGGFEGSDVDEAQLEEQEALALQHQLNAAISIDDYNVESLLAIQTKVEKQPDKTLRRVEELSEEERMALFVEQSGVEVDGLIEEYRNKRARLVDALQPLVAAVHDGALAEQLQCAIEIYSNYLLHINFYFYLKSTTQMTMQGDPMRNHPVFSKMMKWKKLVDSTDEFFDHLCIGGVETMLKRFANGDESQPIRLQSATKVGKKLRKKVTSSDDDGVDGEEMTSGVRNERYADEEAAIGRRRITYEISKNKGLTTRRRKDQRHSRIKRRSQYDKALIRKRSQMPDVKQELSKYSGETRGIKASVVKSVKLRA